MKNLYDIFDRKGNYLCSQVAKNEAEAIDFARMYGHRRAARAQLVRED